MAERTISQILRSVWGESDVAHHTRTLDEVADPITLDEADLQLPVIQEVPEHERLLNELERKRQNLYNSEALLVAAINEKHANLASTRMGIQSVEAAIINLRNNPITPQVIEKTTPRPLVAPRNNH